MEDILIILNIDFCWLKVLKNDLKFFNIKKYVSFYFSYKYTQIMSKNIF